MIHRLRWQIQNEMNADYYILGIIQTANDENKQHSPF